MKNCLGFSIHDEWIFQYHGWIPGFTFFQKKCDPQKSDLHFLHPICGVRPPFFMVFLGGLSGKKRIENSVPSSMENMAMENGWFIDAHTSDLWNMAMFSTAIFDQRRVLNSHWVPNIGVFAGKSQFFWVKTRGNPWILSRSIHWLLNVA